MSVTSPRAALAKAPSPIVDEEAAPLRVVFETSRVQKRRAWPYVTAACLLLIIAVVVPVILSTQMAQRAYDIRDQQLILTELEVARASLEAQILQESCTESLQKKAEEIGLVPAGTPGVISLADSSVVKGEAAQ